MIEDDNTPVTSGAGGGGYAGGASGNARRIMSDAVTTFDVDSTPPGEPYLLTDARGAGQKSDLPIRMFMAGGGGAGSSFIDTNRILLDPTDGSSSAGNGATTLDTRNGGSVTVDYTVPC